jgi:hypothetical protein
LLPPPLQIATHYLLSAASFRQLLPPLSEPFQARYLFISSSRRFAGQLQPLSFLMLLPCRFSRHAFHAISAAAGFHTPFSLPMYFR